MPAGIIIKAAVLLNRNHYGLMNRPAVPNQVNLEACPLVNIGDCLGPVVSRWMLEKHSIAPERPVKGTQHLLTVGSVLSFAFFDATVWGSGILNAEAAAIIRRKRALLGRRLDVRAVRGPLSREALLSAGYRCPAVYGDPAVLLPMLYAPSRDKKYRVSVIPHFKTPADRLDSGTAGKLHVIDPSTTDWRAFVDEICSSELVVSASLHGIILAESYGVPAIFLYVDKERSLVKYRDWYLSTGRELQSCASIDEALQTEPAPLPQLAELRTGLLDSFPYDLWEGGTL